MSDLDELIPRQFLPLSMEALQCRTVYSDGSDDREEDFRFHGYLKADVAPFLEELKARRAAMVRSEWRLNDETGLRYCGRCCGIGQHTEACFYTQYPTEEE